MKHDIKVLKCQKFQFVLAELPNIKIPQIAWTKMFLLTESKAKRVSLITILRPSDHGMAPKSPWPTKQRNVGFVK